MSRYLIDTQALAWFFTDTAKLSKKAFSILKDSNIEVIIPTVVLAELMHVAKKRLEIDFKSILNQIKSLRNCEICPLNLEVIEEMLQVDDTLEMHDRIIVASAMLTNASLISKDSKIQKIYKKTVW